MKKINLFLIASAIFITAASSFAQSFSFEMTDTLVTIARRDTTYGFHGHVTNLLPLSQDLIYTLTPVNFPNPTRQSSICTYQGCYPPQTGEFSITQPYEPSQVDSGVIFEIYAVADNDTSSIFGTHQIDVTVRDQAQTPLIITYRLHLIDTETGIDVRIEPLPLSHDLLSNYPNPFNPETRIVFTIVQAGVVDISIYNMLGQRVTNLVNSNMIPGNYGVTWNGTDHHGAGVSSGTYLITLTAPGKNLVHNAVLLR